MAMNETEFRTRLIAELHNLNKNLSEFNGYCKDSMDMSKKYTEDFFKKDSFDEEPTDFDKLDEELDKAVERPTYFRLTPEALDLIKKAPIFTMEQLEKLCENVDEDEPIGDKESNMDLRDFIELNGLNGNSDDPDPIGREYEDRDSMRHPL